MATASAVLSGVAAATAVASRKVGVAGRNVRIRSLAKEEPGVAELVSSCIIGRKLGYAGPLTTSDIFPMLRPATPTSHRATAVAAATPLNTADAVKLVNP